MPHKRLNVDLDELVFVMDMREGEMHHFLDAETGEIHSVADEDLSEEDADDGEEDRPPGETIDRLPQWQRDARALAARIRADEERYVPIPPIESHEAYGVMEEFVARVADARLRDRLSDAIAGKGAFRRFKDALLRHPPAREEWFAFEAAAKRRLAAEWLDSVGIESTWQPPAPRKAEPS